MAMENDEAVENELIAGELLAYARAIKMICKEYISNENCRKCIFHKKHFYDFCKLGVMDIDEDIYLFPSDWEV